MQWWMYDKIKGSGDSLSVMIDLLSKLITFAPNLVNAYTVVVSSKFV